MFVTGELPDPLPPRCAAILQNADNRSVLRVSADDWDELDGVLADLRDASRSGAVEIFTLAAIHGGRSRPRPALIPDAKGNEVNYRIETTESRRLSERLRRVLPAGDTRTVTYYPPYPLALARGEGCHVWDIDGNVFVDLLNNYTSLVHGHAHPADRRGGHRTGPARHRLPGARRAPGRPRRADRRAREIRRPGPVHELGKRSGPDGGQGRPGPHRPRRDREGDRGLPRLVGAGSDDVRRRRGRRSRVRPRDRAHGAVQRPRRARARDVGARASGSPRCSSSRSSARA